MYISLCACGISTSPTNVYRVCFGCGCAMTCLSISAPAPGATSYVAAAASLASRYEASTSLGDGNDTIAKWNQSLKNTSTAGWGLCSTTRGGGASLSISI